MVAILVLLLGCGPGEGPKDDTGAPPDDTGDSGVDSGPVDEDADGWPAGEDCNDASARAYPGAPERCDGIDNDCDGAVDAADDDLLDGSTWYRDADLDGYGDPAEPDAGCGEPTAGWSADATDCDDADAAVNPGATEECNGHDDDCDDRVDATDPDGPPLLVWFRDRDADGWGTDAEPEVETCEDLTPEGYALYDGDCDDADASVHPGATETCNDLDDDCDGATDAADPDVADARVLYPDRDADGFGDMGATAEVSCEGRSGWVEDAGDCDDADGAVHPDADETCDRGVDNDCDGYTDGQDDDVVDAYTWYRDADGDGLGDASDSRLACSDADGWVLNDDDCDDGDPAVGRC